MTILKVVACSIRVMVNALVMATIENQDPTHMSICPCIPQFSTILAKVAVFQKKI
jgi:hypothetical protein